MTVKLYSYVKSILNNNENILDLYCGSGGIGIFVSDKVSGINYWMIPKAGYRKVKVDNIL